MLTKSIVCSLPPFPPQSIRYSIAPTPHRGRSKAWLGPEALLWLHSALGLSNWGGGIHPGDVCGKELQRTPTYKTEAPFAQLSI